MCLSVCLCARVCIPVRLYLPVHGMFTRIGAPVFVCMCVGPCVFASTVLPNLSREVGFACLSSHAHVGGEET